MARRWPGTPQRIYESILNPRLLFVDALVDACLAALTQRIQEHSQPKMLSEMRWGAALHAVESRPSGPVRGA